MKLASWWMMERRGRNLKRQASPGFSPAPNCLCFLHTRHGVGKLFESSGAGRRKKGAQVTSQESRLPAYRPCAHKRDGTHRCTRPSTTATHTQDYSYHWQQLMFTDDVPGHRPTMTACHKLCCATIFAHTRPCPTHASDFKKPCGEANQPQGGVVPLRTTYRRCSLQPRANRPAPQTPPRQAFLSF